MLYFAFNCTRYSPRFSQYPSRMRQTHSLNNKQKSWSFIRVTVPLWRKMRILKMNFAFHSTKLSKSQILTIILSILIPYAHTWKLSGATLGMLADVVTRPLNETIKNGQLISLTLPKISQLEYKPGWIRRRRWLPSPHGTRIKEPLRHR